MVTTCEARPEPPDQDLIPLTPELGIRLFPFPHLTRTRANNPTSVTQRVGGFFSDNPLISVKRSFQVDIIYSCVHDHSSRNCHISWKFLTDLYCCCCWWWWCIEMFLRKVTAINMQMRWQFPKSQSWCCLDVTDSQFLSVLGPWHWATRPSMSKPSARMFPETLQIFTSDQAGQE